MPCKLKSYCSCVMSSDVVAAAVANPDDETTWVDAWIRWERNSMAVYNDDEGEDQDDDQSLPPPTESHCFTYPALHDGEDDIVIELKGFESDSEQIWNSTGLTLWRSSKHLCDYLYEIAPMLKQKNILELGSGLGRCGILASKLVGDSEGSVFLTDGDTDTLTQLRANIDLNGPLSIRCHQLLWGAATASTFLERHAHTSGNPFKFDIIFGSDLIYVEKVISPLFDTVQTLLSSGPNSKFVMAHCCRRQGNEVDLDMVLAAAEKAGFERTLAKEEDDIFVFIFERRKGS
jgi:predicted nicotinamide N-methyase